MTAYVGYVDNTSMLAHYAMLQKIRDVCQAEGWTILRYDTSIANRELIMRAPGLSGTKQIHCGVYCYQDASLDYYNLAVATMRGYVPGNTFAAQPGISPILGVPAHNMRIDYWLSVNAQRLNVAMKVGTPVYESFGIGEFFPFATPGQYPQPLFAAGMLPSASATRYSDYTHSMPWKGNRDNLRMHANDGTWRTPLAMPWSWADHETENQCQAMSIKNRPADTTYALYPVMLYDANNIYGVLGGIYYINGFGNAVENTLTIDGKNYVVIQDVGRTGFGDYIAMELS